VQDGVDRDARSDGEVDDVDPVPREGLGDVADDDVPAPGDEGEVLQAAARDGVRGARGREHGGGGEQGGQRAGEHPASPPSPLPASSPASLPSLPASSPASLPASFMGGGGGGKGGRPPSAVSLVRRFLSSKWMQSALVHAFSNSGVLA